jgi:phage/plasmid-associated DNA primase
MFWVLLKPFTVSLCCSLKKKSFRQYKPALGTWMLITSEEMTEKVCCVIRDTRYLSGMSSVNNPRFWLSFLNWYEVAENKKLTSTRPLIGFKNFTLDTLSMTVLEHRPENYCFQAIDTEFRLGPPTEETLQFFFRLGSYDPVKVNLIRGFLKLAITGDCSKQIIPFLTGGSGSGKTTFFNFL